MKQIFFAILAIASFSIARGQESGTSGHSLFSMMPNYSADKYSIIKRDFDQLKYLVPDAKNSAGYAEVLKEGAFEECRFAFNGTMQQAPSNLQILQNFKNAVTQKGGQVIFEDKFYKDKIYLKLKKDGDTYWVKVYADGIGNYTISSIRETAMKQDVVLNAGEIKNTLDAEGRVSFYGIYFDTDKAVVKSESAPTLTAIAAFLKSNPVTVYVVGHTDNTGDFARNSALSKDRATAVTEALVTQYGVKRSQVIPQGVGPLAPVSSNRNEEGKARNRRVELVVR
ncbi:OmpA family protein [Taibaiella chishuiensis]|uniref:OmpA family protein n=1 Tax=Taibaiella chishuiensis TaxID=1434707 RepID=A0A2P8CV14_9BACT|nr:OmpA family protein [Taibaiella chishuiensis]PSK88798.1 OmpA family protein [Taibaiella chishuiensis]